MIKFLLFLLVPFCSYSADEIHYKQCFMIFNQATFELKSHKNCATKVVSIKEKDEPRYKAAFMRNGYNYKISFEKKYFKNKGTDLFCLADAEDSVTIPSIKKDYVILSTLSNVKVIRIRCDHYWTLKRYGKH